MDDPGAARQIGHRGRLGDLETQPGGIDTGALKLLANKVDEAGIAGGLPGQVDRKAVQFRHVFAMRRDPFHGRSGDPAVDRAHAVVSLGGIDELRDRQWLGGPALHSEQHLVMRRQTLIRPDRHDRLAAQPQLTALERLVNLHHPMHRLLATRDIGIIFTVQNILCCRRMPWRRPGHRLRPAAAC